MSNFPTTLDNWPPFDCNSGNPADVLNPVRAAVLALEAKVGIDSSLDASTLDYLLKNPASSNPGHTHTLADGATDVTASPAEVNVLAGATPGTAVANRALVVDSGKNITLDGGDFTGRLITASCLLAPLTVGSLINGKMEVFVMGNNLTVRILTLSGAVPSVTNPVVFVSDRGYHTIASSLSLTINAGTNWFASGSSELATREVDYFLYLAWDSSNSAVRIGIARIPYVNIYSGFSGTTTNEKYGVFDTAPGANDRVFVVGRFAAILSAGASFNWSVPTFTGINLVQFPVRETRRLSYTPAWSGSGSLTYTSVTVATASYRIVGARLFLDIETTAGTTGGSASSTILATLPFTPAIKSVGLNEAGDGASFFAATCEASPALNRIRFFRDANFGNWTLGTARTVIGSLNYEL